MNFFRGRKSYLELNDYQFTVMIVGAAKDDK